MTPPPPPRRLRTNIIIIEDRSGVAPVAKKTALRPKKRRRSRPNRQLAPKRVPGRRRWVNFPISQCVGKRTPPWRRALTQRRRPRMAPYLKTPRPRLKASRRERKPRGTPPPSPLNNLTSKSVLKRKCLLASDNPVLAWDPKIFPRMEVGGLQSAPMLPRTITYFWTNRRRKWPSQNRGVNLCTVTLSHRAKAPIRNHLRDEVASILRPRQLFRPDDR